MSLRASATRYARALFDVAVKESDAARVGQDLASLVSTIHGHEDLRRVLTGAAVPRAVRSGVAGELVTRLQIGAPLPKMVALLADRGRLELLPEIAIVYQERLLQHRKIERVHVTSAAPLDADRQARLTARLSEVTGKAVQVDASVDASLIGGLVARIGSTVYDGSVQTQLKILRRRLVETPQ